MIKSLGVFVELVLAATTEVEVEGEVPEDAGQGHGGLEHGELVADALPGAAAEGEVGEVCGGLGGIELSLPLLRVESVPAFDGRILEFSGESQRVEVVRVLPVEGGAVDVVEGDEHVHSPDDGGVGSVAGGALGESVLGERKRGS